MNLTWIGRSASAQLPLASIRLHTSLQAAGILEWESPCRDFFPQEGDTVRLEGEQGIFCGYIFRIEDDGNLYRILCYDQLKYLLYKDTRQFLNMTADAILWDFIREKALQPGNIAATGSTIPSLLFENQTLFSMISDALDETFRISGNRFLFFDEFGKLTLRQIGTDPCDILLCGQNQLTGWLRTSDIDGETFTHFKLLQEDGRSGFRRIVEADNPEQRQKWGTLQYFERVDHTWNEAQLNARLQSLRQNYRDARSSFTVQGIADFRCLAGREVFCQIQEESPVRCLIEESSIEGKGGVYSMSLKLREVS